MATAATPRAALRSDRVAGWITGGRLAVLVFAFARLFDLGIPRSAALAAAGGLYAASTCAWPRFCLVRTYFLVTGVFPWRSVAFTEDAHARGVLRLSGPAYQFRHALLRDRLLTRALAANRMPQWAGPPREARPWQQWVTLQLNRVADAVTLHRRPDELFYVARSWHSLGYQSRAVDAARACVALPPATDPRVRHAILADLGDYLSRDGRPDEAERILRDLLRERADKLDPTDPYTIGDRLDFADFLLTWGRAAEARAVSAGLAEFFTRMLGGNHPLTRATLRIDYLTGGSSDSPGSVLNNWDAARLNCQNGFPDEAKTCLEAEIAGSRRHLGARHPHTLAARAALVRVKAEHLGAPRDACAREMAEIARLLARRLRPDHPEVRGAEIYAAYLATS